MSPEKGKEKQLFDQTAEMLWRDWDPIGVFSENDELPDEYNHYVPYIYQLAVDGSDPHNISSKLESIFQQDLGGPNEIKCPKEKHLLVAKLIVKAKESILG